MRLKSIAVVGAMILGILVPGGAVKASTSSDELRILTVGDSITCGGPYDAYRPELSRLLDSAGVDHVMMVACQGGSKCTDWKNWIKPSLDAWLPDLVLLECGTNDATATSQDQYRFEDSVRSIIETILTNRPEDPIKVGMALIQYSDERAPMRVWNNDLVPSEKRANYFIDRNTNLYNSTGKFVGKPDFQRIPSTLEFYSLDGLHPNQRGYDYRARMWYDAVAPQMGWPQSAEPEPCGLSGVWRDWPEKLPFTDYISCINA